MPRLRAITVCAALAAAAGVLAAAPAAARPAPDGFADLAERLSPTVVNISTAQTLQRNPLEGMPLPQVPPGSPFEDLFRDFFGQGPNRPQRVTSLGSGFVIDTDGYIVTNNHVIAEADEIEVNFADGTSVKAEVVGRDPKTDIALLKIAPPRGLVAVEFGDSARMRVGEWVMAIGNPFGLGGSVTAGIVSAFNRDINAGPYDDFIQTDAAINRGNSGGPLFNMAGEVIGVNTAIYSPTGGSVGIGFAIPSNIVREVVDQLRRFGETRRGWIGVRVQSVTDEIAESLGLGSARGALIAEITPGGPAAAAGLESGDVVLEFDGREVPDMRALPRMVAETAVGRTVALRYLRRGEMRSARITLGRLEENDPDATQTPRETPSEAPPRTENDQLGLTLAELTPALRRQYSVPESVTGVVVTAAARDSVAVERGILVGDVIVEVAQERVTRPADVARLIAATMQTERRSLLLLVNRQGTLNFVAVPLDE